MNYAKGSRQLSSRNCPNPSAFWLGSLEFPALVHFSLPHQFLILWYLLRQPVGKTTLAAIIASRINDLYVSRKPGLAGGSHTPVAAFVPMDGYHLSRAQLDAMPDPTNAHARRGAAFTFDGESFLKLVKQLREPLCAESKTVHAPSFDHAMKDPVYDDIPIAPTARVVIFEGNYLSLSKSPWQDAAKLMDELWFVDVDFDVARERLVKRHVKAGIASDEQDAHKRVTENDLVNGKEIVDDKLEVDEVVYSREEASWGPESQDLEKS